MWSCRKQEYGELPPLPWALGEPKPNTEVGMLSFCHFCPPSAQRPHTIHPQPTTFPSLLSPPPHWAKLPSFGALLLAPGAAGGCSCPTKLTVWKTISSVSVLLPFVTLASHTAPGTLAAALSISIECIHPLKCSLKTVPTISTSHPPTEGMLETMTSSEHAGREGAGSRNGAAGQRQPYMGMGPWDNCRFFPSPWLPSSVEKLPVSSQVPR